MNLEQTLLEIEKHPEQFEVTLKYQGGLVCPNPREYHKNTRRYAAMRMDYDLAHLDEVPREDLMKLAILIRNQKQETFFNPLFLIPIIQIVLLGLLMFSRYHY